MTSKWQNSDAGPRQVKDLQQAIGKLRSEGQARDELMGVIGGEEHRYTTIGMMGPVRPEVAALEDAIKERYALQVTRANVRAIIADYEAALPEARKSRPVDDQRRTPEQDAELKAAQAARDAEYQAKQDAANAVLNQVKAKAPAGAKALIVAEYRVDNSDVMTDYFDSRTTRTVAIGFRSSSREDFRALRAAAAQFPETAHMASDDTLKAWGEANGTRIWFDLEHRDNYSMGGGNYLSDHGSDRSGTGWIVRSAALTSSYTHLTEDAIPDQPAQPATPERTPAGPRSTSVGSDVLDILSRATVTGNAVQFTDRMDRATYLAVAEVLKAEGGKWNRKAQAILFPGDAAPIVAAILEDGTVTRPQDEGYFPTPPPVVADILDLADLEPGMEVLEPSAGDGAIARAVYDRGCKVDCVELNAKRADALRAEGYARMVSAADFLNVPQAPLYDRVLMNPPFAAKADIEHVRHALGFLRPGGLLVAVMSAGTEFRDDRATAEFRELVEDHDGVMIPLPEDSFKVSGTGVRTVLVAMTAPAAASQAA